MDESVITVELLRKVDTEDDYYYFDGAIWTRIKVDEHLREDLATYLSDALKMWRSERPECQWWRAWIDQHGPETTTITGELDATKTDDDICELIIHEVLRLVG